MKLPIKNIFRTAGLSLLAAALLSSCGGAGSCTNCNTTPVGSLTLSIEAPSQYPAGLPTPIEAQLTMTNTSNVNATNLVYTIPAPVLMAHHIYTWLGSILVQIMVCSDLI